ncbi:hypothetical protein [Streptomyces albipurpureus]|uniref:Uncharacterized protein n=1 Tax=Streptomyces albipurpureus TaxID=2897419 RepID=A0ABT0UNI0_9ACTN|nr:hypothetical protein [Streptomyces sp. CWNU-1]MCM2388811.1 hypothetical protein [Streptomyces sp. CWNU-1]
MTTTETQFDQRLAELEEDWITRKQLEHLAGVSAKTLRNWLAADPIPEEKTRTGPHSVQLIEKATGAQWARGRLFGPRAADRRSGPRLAAAPQPLSHAPGERWRWSDIARLRGVTPGAISNLGRAYAAHSERPFPPAGGDRKRDAAAVASWFAWYDDERPGYADRGAKANGTPSGTQHPTGRVAEVSGILRTVVTNGLDLTADVVAEHLGVGREVAARYLSQAADVVMPEYGLIAQTEIAGLLPGGQEQLTPAQRRERVKTLLRKKSAPRSVLTVGSTRYFRRTDIEELVVRGL